MPGYQVVQTAHSIADFAAEYPQKFSQWKNESNSIISLSTDSEESLLKLYNKFKDKTDVVLFYEPDISAYTSLCLYGTHKIRKSLSHLPLSLKKLNCGGSSGAEPKSLKLCDCVGSKPTTRTNSNINKNKI